MKIFRFNSNFKSICISVFLPLIIFSCTNFNFDRGFGIKDSDKKKNSLKKEWEGSPFIEWESSTFLNPLLPRITTKAGILAYEGTVSDKGFQIEKAVLLDLKNGQKIWRHAYRPVITKNESLWKAEFKLIKTGTNTHPYIIASWVKGNLFRIQDLKTGDDLWNKPDCSNISIYKNRIIGYCSERLKIMESLSGLEISNFKINFKPAVIKNYNDLCLIIGDHDHNLYLYYLSGDLYPAQIPYKTKYIEVHKDKIFLITKHDDGYVFELNEIRGFQIVKKWQVNLNADISFFWIHEFEDLIIYPIGSECISAANLKTGKIIWTSCGVYEKSPPAWDEGGLYMLSSRLVQNQRPLIFVDGGNGMQTPLFQNSIEEGSVKPILASYLTPGKAYGGMIYAVKNKSKIIAIRIAAPE